MGASIRRRTIALVAAYAVVMQALLPSLALALAVGEKPPVLSAEICANAANPGNRPPGKDHSGCVHGVACLMAGCSGMAAALAHSFERLALGPVSSAAVALRPTEATVPRIALPHGARAPPRA